MINDFSIVFPAGSGVGLDGFGNSKKQYSFDFSVVEDCFYEVQASFITRAVGYGSPQKYVTKVPLLYADFGMPTRQYEAMYKFEDRTGVHQNTEFFIGSPFREGNTGNETSGMVSMECDRDQSPKNIMRRPTKNTFIISARDIGNDYYTGSTGSPAYLLQFHGYFMVLQFKKVVL